MRGVLALARPLNCGMSAVGVSIAAIATAGIDGLGSRALPIGLAALAAGLFTAAGNALNDYFDLETDRVNHPDRPIPSGEISPNQARAFSAVFFGLSLAAAAWVNLLAIALVAANLLVMVSYEKVFKVRGASGNALIAYLVASLFVFGGVAAYGGDLQALSRAVILGLLAGLATIGREIAKDIEDISGDVDRRTLPRRVGIRPAAAIAAVAFAAGVVLSVLPYSFAGFGLLYLAIVACADIRFIYGAACSARNPARAQRVAKYGMVVALVAFLAGGLA